MEESRCVRKDKEADLERQREREGQVIKIASVKKTAVLKKTEKTLKLNNYGDLILDPF